MSLDATRWAWKQRGLKASQKLILLSLSDRAGFDHTARLSCKQISSDTGCDQKTILSAMVEMERCGILSVWPIQDSADIEYKLLVVEE